MANRSFVAVALLAVLFVGAAHASSRAPPPRKPSYSSLQDLVNKRKDLSIAKYIAEEMPDWFLKLYDNFSGTMAIPNDAAFEMYTEIWGGLEAFKDLPGRYLGYLMLYHTTFEMAAYSKDLKGTLAVDTALFGYKFTVAKTSHGVAVASPHTIARVIEADIKVGKGVAHIVDRVLIPFEPATAEFDFDPYASLGDVIKALGSVSLYGAMAASKDGQDILDSTDLVGTMALPTEEAFTAFVAEVKKTNVTGPALDYAVNMILGDHLNLARAYDSETIAGVKQAPVGWNVTAYGTPQGHYFDVEIRSDGLYLKGYTTGKVIFPDVPVGQGKFLIHLVDSVMITAQTAKALGLSATAGGR
ncbi:hypothetical protein HYH02_007522 [Chlamydomonas schloesseri]|uniref:FAS1 domain-containing protein n=1 Tax=Chlamydomonas schloesseri TaxID=2026947 RepID=A0A835WHB0_9CHLO|nr:hypothetical protein HYH02_007522 [Chlamydomonas schloesseri]|eukprot:KAG2447599.1 hypothetical protein HYH02_007522 [Chlamydomonas schloesseri]